MNTIRAIVTLGCALLVQSCATKTSPQDRFSHWIYPSAKFENTASVKRGQNLASIARQLGQTEESMLEEWRRIWGATYVDELLSDAFVTNSYMVISFLSPTHAPVVAHYYGEILKEENWNQTRDRPYVHEELNHTGWESFGVYEKSGSTLMVRVIGVQNEDALPWNPTSITMCFIALKPRDILGDNFRAKGTEKYDPWYHINSTQIEELSMTNRTIGSSLSETRDGFLQTQP